MHTLRAKLLWLMAGRAAVITLLLGSALLIRLKFPGAFPIDPFFVLIGITYALTAIYGMVLKYSEKNRWLVDVQLGCDAVIVSAIVYITERDLQLLLVALYAADHRREHDSVAARRDDGRGAQLVAVQRARAGAVLRRGFPAGSRGLRLAAGVPDCRLYRRPEHLRVLRGGGR